MSENKRYKLSELFSKQIIQDGEILTQHEVVDLLNEQEEEIHRLKTMNNELIKTIQGISKDNAETIIKLWTGDKE